MTVVDSTRLEVRRGDILKNGTEQIGARTKVKIVKNKVAPPFRTAEFDIIFVHRGDGTNNNGPHVEIARDDLTITMK